MEKFEVGKRYYFRNYQYYKTATVTARTRCFVTFKFPDGVRKGAEVRLKVFEGHLGNEAATWKPNAWDASEFWWNAEASDVNGH